MICLFFWVREFVCLLGSQFSLLVRCLLQILNETITPLFIKRKSMRLKVAASLHYETNKLSHFSVCNCPFIFLPYKTCSWFTQNTIPYLQHLNFSSLFHLFLPSNNNLSYHLIIAHSFGAIACQIGP